ncbi:dihydrolipoyl dehydrogenase family protein [Pediococcus siamensis]|uniref:dihydrolipoyl dehydrogenase family protein n=1 Tax=Pediococcus siamensis TaxID=381829 RepID=UPI0039A08B15
MENYDVIFIGSGHANWHAAVALRQAGKSIAIIEKDKIAGTCTNYGCDPKILLDGPFELADRLNQYKGISVSEAPKIDWPQLMAYKHQAIDPLALQMTALFKQLGIAVYMGEGKLTDAHTVAVNDQHLHAETIVLGTGQRAAKLNIPGKEYLHDNQDFLDLPQMPKRMTFIGAGVISLEFATMASELGSEVEVVEFADRALAAFDLQYVMKLVDKLKQKGVHFNFNEAVSEVQKEADHYKVVTNKGHEFVTDYVIDATGRVANTEKLGLEEVGVDFNRSGIVVDSHLRTSVKNIYASGDVIDKQIPRLTPTATFESNYIAQQLLGSSAEIQYPVVPMVVYGLPRIAQVGVSPEEANGSDGYHVQAVPYGKQLLFQYKNEVEAEMKLVFDQDNYLVGASIYGEDAPELINLITFIIEGHLTANDLDQKIFAFPSASIGIISIISVLLHRD